MNWNPWKVTAIAMGLVLATALITGLVVANWTGSERDAKLGSQEREARGAAERDTKASAVPAQTKRVASAPVAATHAPATPRSAVPTQSVVDACNREAAAQAGQQDKTLEVVKDAAIGAVVGAAVGAAGGAVADGGKGAGKGAAIGGIVGAGGGTLYGLNETKKHDEYYRAAYAGCMRSRGYAS